MTMTQCPCCLTQIERKSIYKREHCPAMNNVTYETEREAVGSPVGELELILCHKCGLVFNSVFDATLLNYDRRYDNSRNSSKAYCDYLDELVANFAGDISKDAKILEVGCGNGDFLKILCEKTGASGFGYDQTYTGEVNYKTATLYKEYFKPPTSRRTYDVLVLRHDLEHDHQPYLFLKDLCRSEVLVEGAKIWIETPDLEWIVKRGAFYDVTYEHCNYFSKDSLATLVSSIGFCNIRSTNVFGGQYLLLEAAYRAADQKWPEGNSSTSGVDLKNVFDTFQKRCSDLIRTSENLCVWGASGKGVIFLSCLDAELSEKVKRVVDINRNKQGRYLPGSAKCVQAPEVLKQVQGCIDVLIMNEVYSKEIESDLQEMGVVSRVHIC